MVALVGTAQQFTSGAAGAGVLFTNADGAPAVGDFDVLFINSDTIVTGVSSTAGAAWTQRVSSVANQGAYIYARKATGGEPATVTVTTSGNFNMETFWLRASGGNAVDIATHAQASAFGTVSSPALTTAALAATGEMALAFAALHSLNGPLPSAPSWSTGYTNRITGNFGGVAGTGVAGFVATKSPAGTAAESPSVSWTGGVGDAYMLIVTITDAGGTPVNVADLPKAIRFYPAADASVFDTVTADQAPVVRFGIRSDAVTSDVVTADQAPPIVFGMQVEVVVSDVVTTDQAPVVRFGRAQESIALDIVSDDQAPPIVWGTAAEGSVLDIVLADAAPAVRFGRSVETLDIQGLNEIVVQDLPKGILFGRSAETLSAGSVVLEDGTVYPMLELALACLSDEVAKVTSPPKYVRMSTGSSFSAQLAPNVADECCEGVAWLRVINVFPSSNFPEQDVSVERFLPDSLAVPLELGVARCLPIADPQVGILTPAQTAANVKAIMDDRAALMRAACCLYDAGRATGEVLDVLIGQWTPLDDEGNCMGGTLALTVQVRACDCA